jgi:hypothetical protein
MDATQQGVGKHKVYEQLGAPSLIYRNVDAYTIEDVMGNTSETAVESYHDSRERIARAQARWYFHMNDVSFANGVVTPEEWQQATVDESAALSRVVRHSDRLRKSALEEQGVCDHRTSQLLNSLQQYDCNYVPARRLKAGRVSKKRPKNRGIQDRVQEISSLCYQERQNRGVPDYMAPFELRCIHSSLSERSKEPLIRKRRQKLVYDRDHPNGPTRYGNCILCFPCTCPACRSSANHSICLLHPAGVILDHVRLSFLSLPLGVHVLETCSDDGNWLDDLDVGDTVRQLQECGDLSFVARTDLHCTLFSVELSKPRKVEEVERCWGWGKITLLRRIDLRSLSRVLPSYKPIDFTCHPNYGRSFSKPNIAILTEDDGNIPDRNTVHNVQCGHSTHTTKHAFANMLSISEIDFTNAHPMVLWAAGRSYVRPALKANTVFKSPRIGYGSSLFTLDLRSDQATFQWSPSKEDFLTEGAHGISGIYTDWTKAHSVWLSSTSAGKTWELDARMPCCPVAAWSLSHACNEPGVVLPSTGLYGAGTLFSKPVCGPSNGNPILSVEKNPGAFGLHIFQRPLTRPRFQSDCIECVASPRLASLLDSSIALSSTFALPDVSDSVFVCGLCCFTAPSSSFMSIPDFVRLGFFDEEVTACMCAVTMTNMGDLYVHSLLESNSPHEASRSASGLPVGASMIAVPDAPSTRIPKGTATLQVQLSNIYPSPSSAFDPPVLLGTKSNVLSVPSRECVVPRSHSIVYDDVLVNSKTLLTVPTEEHQRATLAIPAGLQLLARDQVNASSRYFKDLRAIVEDPEVNPALTRSDVTAKQIQKASDAWNADETDDSRNDDF